MNFVTILWINPKKPSGLNEWIRIASPGDSSCDPTNDPRWLEVTYTTLEFGSCFLSPVPSLADHFVFSLPGLRVVKTTYFRNVTPQCNKLQTYKAIMKPLTLCGWFILFFLMGTLFLGQTQPFPLKREGTVLSLSHVWIVMEMGRNSTVLPQKKKKTKSCNWNQRFINGLHPHHVPGTSQWNPGSCFKNDLEQDLLHGVIFILPTWPRVVFSPSYRTYTQTLNVNGAYMKTPFQLPTFGRSIHQPY